MFYGVEQSTDLNHRQTVIKKFSTESALRRWLSVGQGRYTFHGAADESLPPMMQNWHRTFRKGYRMPRGWRLLKDDVERLRGGDYRKPYLDLVALWIYKCAEESY